MSLVRRVRSIVNCVSRKRCLACCIVCAFIAFGIAFSIIESSTTLLVWRMRTSIMNGTLRISRATPGRLDSGITYIPHVLFSRWAALPIIDVICGKIECLNLTNQSSTQLLSRDTPLPYLKVLISNNSDIADNELARIHGCRNLRRLLLNRTGVTSCGICRFIECNAILDLEELQVGEAAIDDRLCSVLGSLGKLKRIHLAETRVTNATARVIGRLDAVEEISVSHTLITADGVAGFARMPNLATMYCDGISGIGSLDIIVPFRSLEYLSVADTSINDAGLRALPQCRWITSLILDGCVVSDEAIPNIIRCERLVRVGLRRTRMSAQGIAQLRISKPAIKCMAD